MKLFFAIKPPPKVCSQIEELVEQIQPGFKGMPIKWIPKANYHITVQFMGQFDEAQLPKLTEHVTEALNGIQPFTVEFTKFAYFPSHQQVKVFVLLMTPLKELIQSHLVIVLGEYKGGGRKCQVFSQF